MLGQMNNNGECEASEWNFAGTETTSSMATAASPAPPPLPLSLPLPPPPPPEGPVIQEESRTIFLLGFPGDVKERELHNMLRFWQGYEASQMNFNYDQPMGFALFSTAAVALAARDALQNLVFDADIGPSVLRVEMAKKNLVVKRGVVADPNSCTDGSKRMRTTGGGEYVVPPGPFSAAPYPAQPVAHVAAAAPSPYPAQPLPHVAAPAPSWSPQIYCTQPQYAVYGAMPQAAPIAPPIYVPLQSTKDNPPCNTLFVGKLGEPVNENALRTLFSQQPGFKQMKVVRQTNNNTVCFIEFMDVNSAISVHANLQGAVLSPSDIRGMRIQFSKNPYGTRRSLRESTTNEHYDEGATMPTMVPLMAPGMEANGGIEYMLPTMVTVVRPQEHAVTSQL